MDKLDNEQEALLFRAFVQYSPNMLAELRWLRAEVVRLRSIMPTESPWCFLIAWAGIGIGWPLAFGHYLSRFNFDHWCGDYAIMTLLYLVMLGMLLLNTITPRRSDERRSIADRQHQSGRSVFRRWPAWVLLHIPPVMDPVTGEPIPLVIDATVTVTPPNGAARTFARYMENLLTSSQGYNLISRTPAVIRLILKQPDPLSSMVP